MPLQHGYLLNNRYRIVKLIGQGGFGAVYRAWDVNLKGAVAVKESLDTSPAALEQFELEAHLLFKLRHPNLPRVSDYFIIEEQGQYLVMDFIEGDDLVSLVEQRPNGLPIKYVLDLLIQVCDALIYLHSQDPPVIHRDIKPANIRTSPEGQAILVDFGLAKVYDPQRITKPGAQSITPGYSPPEQFGLGTTNPQSDVYALGATAYHLLTGQAPPPAMDIMANLATSPPSVHQIRPQIEHSLSDAIERAMLLDRSERLASIAELKAAFLTQLQIETDDRELDSPSLAEIVSPTGAQFPAASFAPDDESRLPAGRPIQSPVSSSKAEGNIPLHYQDGGFTDERAAPLSSTAKNSVIPQLNSQRRVNFAELRAWLPWVLGLILLIILLSGMLATGVAVWRGIRPPTPPNDPQPISTSQTTTASLGPLKVILTECVHQVNPILIERDNMISQTSLSPGSYQESIARIWFDLTSKANDLLQTCEGTISLKSEIRTSVCGKLSTT